MINNDTVPSTMMKCQIKMWNVLKMWKCAFKKALETVMNHSRLSFQSDSVYFLNLIAHCMKIEGLTLQTLIHNSYLWQLKLFWIKKLNILWQYTVNIKHTNFFLSIYSDWFLAGNNLTDIDGLCLSFQSNFKTNNQRIIFPSKTRNYLSISISS